MDKYEYKVRADEIKALIAEGDYAEAVKIADTIDWRRVKSVMMLCTISDLYKINRKYQESKEILLLAYEKHPTGRLIVYSLCELAIKMEEYVQAIEYYKEFVQIAPRDTGRYILQYRLYEAQDVSLEERIAVLEEFKKRDYREKWAYELAYLYHRIGLTTKCVEECDEMYLWFGEGKYVLKALELKALHTTLSAEQQAKYEGWIMERDAGEEVEEDPPEEMEEESYGQEEDIQEEEIQVEEIEEEEPEEEEPESEPDIATIPTTELPEVKTIDMGQYNTLNLQMALAESMREILTEEEDETEPEPIPILELEKEPEIAEVPQETKIVEMPRKLPEPVRPVVAEGQGTEVEPEEKPISPIVEQIIAPLLQETVEIPKAAPVQDADELQEIVVEDSVEILNQMKQETITGKIPAEEVKSELNTDMPRQETYSVRYDDVLSQENDGQIRLVVPDVKAIEKQITGQLSIEDIMAEWEAMKKDNEQKRREAVKQRIMEHTGSLFADFDEATKSGLLEQLEKAFVAAILKESGKQPAIKKVVLPDEAEKELKAAAKPAPKTVRKEPVQKPETEDFERIDEIEEITEITEPEISETAEAVKTVTAVGMGDADDFEEIEEVRYSEELEPEEEIEIELPYPEVEKEMQEAAAVPEPQRQQGSSRNVRELSEEEKELFGQYVHHRKSREQLIHVLDNMSMAAYTGNVIITGEEGSGTLSLAKGLIREMQYNDSNFSGKVAKISGSVLNKKDVTETLSKISNGALIIEKAADLKAATVARLAKDLEKDNVGLLIILEDTKQRMNGLLIENSILNYSFELRIDIEPLDDEALVAYAKQYAEQMEYSIDEFGVLALHTRIADMQTSDHEVSVAEVRELVDEAIYYANKKTPKHFVDILLAKRYDDDDMIILRENDFMHY